MKALGILALLVIVFLSFFFLGYMLVVADHEEKGVVYTIGVGILAVLAGAVLASFTSTYTIYKREREWRRVRSLMWHQGKGRD